MKQRYEWEVRVGGVLLSLKVERNRVGGIKKKKRCYKSGEERDSE